MGYAFASVVETVQLNKRLRRIVLEVPELDRLQLPKAGDAAVGIYFPDANRPKRPPPMDCRDGVWGYYDATTAPPGRTYSIRNHVRSPTASMLTLSFTATESAAHGPRQPRWRVKLWSRMRGLGIARYPAPTGSCWLRTWPGCLPLRGSLRSWHRTTRPSP